MDKIRILAVVLLGVAPLAWSDTNTPGTLPEEVVIKGQEMGPKIGAMKPPLSIRIDPFESIRPSLEPDRNLFLAQSRLTVGWRHTHPDFLANPRVIEAWRSVFGGRSGILFDLRRELQAVLPNPISDRELKRFQWSLTIADEEGRVYQQYEGSRSAPKELFWNGQNNQGLWIQPGYTYSPVYKFVDSSGSPYTRMGKPIQVSSIARQEPSGLAIGLDSAILFGLEKRLSVLKEPAGRSLLRDTADYIKRNYTDVSLLIRVFAASKDLADAQGEVVQSYLSQELMLPPQGISVQADSAPFREQRVEVVVLNH